MSYRVQEFTLASLYPAWQSVLSWFIPFKVLNPELKTKHLPFGLLLSAHSILGGRWDKNHIGAKSVSIDHLGGSRVRDMAHDPLGLCWVFLGLSLLPRMDSKACPLCVI